jgi:hypothetical protein
MELKLKKEKKKKTPRGIRPSNSIFSSMTLAPTFAKKNHATQKIIKPEHA